MYPNSIVKLKQGIDGSLWEIEKNKEYLVCDTGYSNKDTGEQRMLVLKNKKGKKRKYYEHLFEEIKITEKIDSEKEKNISLRETWLGDDSEQSKDAFKLLQERNLEWEKTIPKVRDKIKFNNGVLKMKFKGREFTIKKIIDSVFFEKIIILREMRGSFKLSDTELTQSCPNQNEVKKDE